MSSFRLSFRSGVRYLFSSLDSFSVRVRAYRFGAGEGEIINFFYNCGFLLSKLLVIDPDCQKECICICNLLRIESTFLVMQRVRGGLV